MTVTDHIIRKGQTGQPGNAGEFGNHDRTTAEVNLSWPPVYAEPLADGPDYAEGMLYAADDDRVLPAQAWIDVDGVDGFEPDERLYYSQDLIFVEKLHDFTQYAPADLTAEEKADWCERQHYLIENDGGFDEDDPWDARWYGFRMWTKSNLSPRQVLDVAREAGLAEKVREKIGRGDFITN